MSQDLARLVLLSILGGGLAIWLWSLVRALAIGRVTRSDTDWTGHSFRGAGAEPARDVVSGEVTVPDAGDPDRLSRALARDLLSSHSGMSGSLFRVEERTPERVVVTKTGPLVLNQPPSLFFSDAAFELEPAGGGAIRVRYTLDFTRLGRRMRRVALWLILGLGLPVLVAIGAVGWFVIIPSKVEAVRWQILQCLHILHVLWPPLLPIFFYSVGRRRAKTFVANLLANLEHTV